MCGNLFAFFFLKKVSCIFYRDSLLLLCSWNVVIKPLPGATHNRIFIRKILQSPALSMPLALHGPSTCTAPQDRLVLTGQGPETISHLLYISQMEMGPYTRLGPLC